MVSNHLHPFERPASCMHVWLACFCLQADVRRVLHMVVRFVGRELIRTSQTLSTPAGQSIKELGLHG